MAKDEFLKKLLPDMSGVFLRFPVAALAVLGLWAVLMAMVNDSKSGDAWNMAVTLSAGFLGAGLGHLFAEGRHWTRPRNLILAAALALLAMALTWLYPTFGTHELFLLPGMATALLVAPFLTTRVEQASIWLFGQRIGLAALLAAIVAGVFGGGLAAIVAALDFLFGFSWPSNTYEYIWITALCLVGPLYGLSLVPDDFEDEIDLTDHRNTVMERGVSVLVNYVLVPLVGVYALIIHAYAAKIILIQDLPRGEIGTMVSLFAFAGTAAWLISWPWRKDGTWLLRMFNRFWFWLIPVPAVLLAIAVWRRVSDYGITPDRYGLGLIAVWSFLMFLYLMARRNASDMRVVIGAVSALLIAASFGPWGANSLTVRDQYARMEALAVETGLIKDGKLANPLPAMPQEKAQRMYSIVDALTSSYGLGKVAAWFPDDKRPVVTNTKDGRWTEAYEMRKALGIDQAYLSPTELRFNARLPLDLKVPANVRLLGPIAANQGKATPATDLKVLAYLDGGLLHIEGKAVSGTVTESQIIAAIKTSVSNTEQVPLMVTVSPKLDIAIHDAYGDSGGNGKMSYINFWILAKE
jgi:hypothetical protein